MKQNLRVHRFVSSSTRFSRTFSSDFDKFLRSQITSRHLKVPRGDAISRNKTWPFTDRRGYRSLESGFLLESLSTYRRPSPSARPAERLENRGALWSIFIQWNTQYGLRLSIPRLSDSKWETVTIWEVPSQRVLIAFKTLSIIFSPNTNAHCIQVASVTANFKPGLQCP